MMAVGVIHVAIAPVLFPRSVRSLVDGVIASVEADPAQAELRGLGFWYITSGVAFVVYGLAVAERERQPEAAAGLTAGWPDRPRAVGGAAHAEVAVLGVPALRRVGRRPTPDCIAQPRWVSRRMGPDATSGAWRCTSAASFAS
jgi:Family of unknown function (DUF6463)